MINAFERTGFGGQNLLESETCGFSDQTRPGGTAKLVAHNSQFFSLARQPHHREHKVLPPGAVNPAKAENQMLSIDLEHGLITREFCAAISTERIRLVVLSVRRGFGAVE